MGAMTVGWLLKKCDFQETYRYISETVEGRHIRCVSKSMSLDVC